MAIVNVLVNDQVVHEYDRDTALDEQQLAFLDKIDSDMDRGIRIRGELISNPDAGQKAMFVAMNLVRALQQGNEAVVAVSCAYLANRNPALTEVHARDHENTVVIEFGT